MTHIEQMIQDMCPNGVEFKTLGEVLDYEQPTPYIVKNTDYDESYSTPVLTAGQSFILGYTNEKEGIYKASKEQPTIIFDDFTTSFHWVDFDFKVKSSAMKMLRPKNDANINFRFVFYAMQCIKFQATEHTRYWISKYSQFEIPLPPLEIQKKIVECLDKFSALAAELQAELQMRRKQYEYYRTQLLTPHSDCNSADNTDDRNWEWKTLGEICEINRGVRVVRSELEQEGKYPVYQNSLTPLGYYDKCNYPANTTFIISAGAAGKVGYSDVDFWAADDCLCIKCPEALNAKFLFYYMLDKQDFFLSQVRHASVPRMSRTIVENFKLPIPSLAEQARIVAILDKFEKLITSMEEGIPAEQIRQQKRYEHFRDLLLTFDRKAV